MKTAFLTVCLALISTGAEADWPQFRGPGGNAVATAVNLPEKWSSTENIAWKASLTGRGASSPVVFGDKIFLTAYAGYGLDLENPGEKSELKLHTLCLDRETGNILWNESVPGSPHEQAISKRTVDHGYATGTPAVDEQGVYAWFGVSGLVAYDHSGKQLWHQQDVGTDTAGFGSASSPVVYKNLVIVNASIEGKALFAFDRVTGEQVWKVPGVQKAWTTPTIAEVPGGPAELLLHQENQIRGFDPLTGDELWTCDGVPDYVVPTAVVHDGIAYFLGGRSNRSMAVKLGGRGNVTATHKLWEKSIGANVTSPVYHDGYLYWASDRGVACCLKADTGETVYQERLPVRGRLYASVVLGDGKIYIPTRDTGVLVIQAGPEYRELATNLFEESDDLINATPAIDCNQLLIRTDSTLYCIGK